MAGPSYFTLNAATVGGGDLSAAYLDGGATPRKHQLIILETQHSGGDPITVNIDNPLPGQIFGQYNLSPPTLPDGTLGAAQLDSAGRLLVNLGAGGIAGIADNGALFTVGVTPGLAAAFIANDAATAMTSGNMGLARMTLNRQQRMVLDLDTAGGLSIHPYLAPATPAAHLVKASAGQLAFVDCFNKGTVPAHLKLYDAASAGAVTVGTTAAIWEVGIPCNASGAGRTFTVPIGIPFTNGLVIAVTAEFGLTDNTSTGLAINKIGIGFGYK